MQQMFPEEAVDQSQKPLFSFPLPRDMLQHSHIAVAGQRKRPRSPLQAEVSHDAPSAASAQFHLTQEDFKALRRFIEYGNQPMTATEFFQKTVGCRPTPAQILTSGVSVQRSSIPPPHQWCSVAVRRALALLCRVIRLDTSSFYSQPTLATDVMPSDPSTASFAAAGGRAARITTLELYCRLQALELELEDTVLRAQSVAQAAGAPEATTQQARADVEATVRCIEDGVNALEETLVEMLLRIEDPQLERKEGLIREACAGGNTKLGASAAATPPLEYVAAMLRGLPDVFHSEQWPANVVCSAEVDALMTNASSPLPPAASSSPLPQSQEYQQQSPGGVAGLLGWCGSVRSAAASGTAGGAQIGGATTSITLQSLLEISKADVSNVFGVATTSPISRLAALEKLKNSSRGGALNDPRNIVPPARPALDIEQLQFKDIVVRAWNHGYGLLGLRRLRFEMQALFYQYTARAAAPGAHANNRATRQEIYRLWCQWRQMVRDLYRSFMEKVTGFSGKWTERGSREVLCTVEVDADLNACALMRRHASSTSELAEVQHIALRVVSKLQAVDKEGWFAVPAFDLVNVDFTSVRYWVMSPSFAHKSRREAYRSLCRVLERMVDSCVLKYGPTHAFSETITNVRQQLVDVARTEGLL
ncbi:hypothetical protein ABL78_0410 [Leptomonas seymouri]|uniref:Uncharacterized protein n=1 Tax=Leptomonas seymouri TaxID=5684 RepID=A0A0N1PGH4_LEPSE|nr:hypothetical protein ABL78_0410 [Leptomonas seymouri]|eukprot:KPI90480.1 hypothetical protein ABL78_0410 [Leptomonas seymouri]